MKRHGEEQEREEREWKKDEVKETRTEEEQSMQRDEKHRRWRRQRASCPCCGGSSHHLTRWSNPQSEEMEGHCTRHRGWVDVSECGDAMWWLWACS